MSFPHLYNTFHCVSLWHISRRVTPSRPDGVTLLCLSLPVFARKSVNSPCLYCPGKGGIRSLLPNFLLFALLLRLYVLVNSFLLHLFVNDLPHMSTFMFINTLQTLEITSSFTITENSFLRTFAPLTTKINLFIYVY